MSRAALPDDPGEFYDRAWPDWDQMARFSPAPRLRRQRILKWLAHKPVRRLLDVGCGNGEFLLAAQRALPGVALAGCDVSAEVIAANRRRLPGIDFQVLDLNQPLTSAFGPAPQYDAVVCMEVVEHCADAQAAVATLAALTGKYLALTVPCGPLFPIDRMVGHTRHFQPNDIRAAFALAGLREERIEAWGFPFFNLYKHLINLRPETMSQAFLSDKPYSLSAKALSLLVYLSFRLSLPVAGYQLFAFASR